MRDGEFLLALLRTCERGFERTRLGLEATGGSVLESTTWRIRSLASLGPSISTSFGRRASRAALSSRATVGEWWRTGNQ